MSRPPVTKNSIRFAVNAKMWYSGSAVSITSSPTRSHGRHACEALLDVGQQVAVRQHRALGDAGGAAGVLQRGERVVRQRLVVDPRIGAGERRVAPSRQRATERRVR